MFTGRNSVGVRGINLADGDKVISMSILLHFDAPPAERSAYIKKSRLLRGVEEDPSTLESANDSTTPSSHPADWYLPE